MYPILKRLLKKQLDDQKGLALIAVVFMLALLGIAAVSEMLITTSKTLQDVNLSFALRWAEQEAIAASSPIRSAIDAEVHRRLQKALLDRLRKRASANQSNQTYVCQGVVDPKLPLSRQWAVCDPVKLLDDLPGAKNKTIDDLAVVKDALKPSAKDLKSPEWKQLEYYLKNSYEYNLKSAFIAQEALDVPKEEDEFGIRTERYRYLVRAELESITYDNVIYPLTVNYDVVVTLNAIPTEDAFPKCSEEGREFEGEFSQVRNKYLVSCADPPGAFPYGPECKQLNMCFDIDRSDPCYNQTCRKDPNDPSNDSCETQNTCGNPAGGNSCFVEPGVIYKGRPFSKTFTSAGCASINNGVRSGSNFGSDIEIKLPMGPNNGSSSGQSKRTVNYVYNWTTAIRIVGIGTRHN